MSHQTVGVIPLDWSHCCGHLSSLHLQRKDEGGWDYTYFSFIVWRHVYFAKGMNTDVHDLRTLI